MSQVEALLDAGALVPIKTKVGKESAVDLISARKYRHRGLGDRPVTRLTADGLARGDDLMMEFMGFSEPEIQGPIAQKRRQALGFPGWALINDPDHARYALEILKQFKKEAKRAKSKPGHAYDGFIDIAKTLGRSVAHFLPSYWEQVGREFINVGNQHYGSRAFGKAREAEKVHAIKIDESLRQEAFLEFALAGCLTNKALTEYGKDLQATHKAIDAWKFFRELAVRRTMGGMPPWVSMLKDVSGLITAAGLDLDKELDSLLEEIIDSPAMNRAPKGFWKASHANFAGLVKRSDHVAGVLLNLLPESSRWDRSGAWAWLDSLKEWGILENAWKEGVSKEAGPSNGAAAWFSRIAKLDDTPPQKVHDILRSMAKKIKKEKQPLDLVVDAYSDQINVDLLDLALELKLSVKKQNPDDVSLSLTDWSTVSEDAVDRPRDPMFIFKSKVFRPMLDAAVQRAVGDPDFEAAAIGKQAMLEARREWLLKLVDSVDKGGIAKAVDVLDTLDNQTTRASFQEFPEAFKALKKVDLTPVVQRTVQAGMLDEYGWPALEAVVKKLNPKGKEELKFFGAAPHVIVYNGVKAVAVGPEGVVAEHEVKLKKGLDVKDIQFIDGEFLVVQSKRWSQTKRYWSSAPKKSHSEWHNNEDVEGFYWHQSEGGGTFTGGGLCRAGDKKLERSEFISDGEHAWGTRWDEKTGQRVLREIEVDTGKEGRKSMPAFFESFIKAGKKLDTGSSGLLPFGDSVKNSPLGSKDGLVGWRIRRNVNKDEKETRYANRTGELKNVECEGIDGRSWKGVIADGRAPIGLMDLPGSTEKMVVAGEMGWSWGEYSNCDLWDSKGEFEIGSYGSSLNQYCMGQAYGLPPLFWHFYEARDVKASKKLRTLSKTQTQTLMKAVLADSEASEEDVDDEELPELKQTKAAIKKWLPALKNEGLSRGLQGVMLKAAGICEALEELLEGRDPDSEDVVADARQEACVSPAMRCLDQHAGWSSLPLFPHLHVAKSFFSGEREDGKTTGAPFNWSPLLDNLDAKIFASYWAHEGLDKNLAEFLQLWSEIGLSELPGSFRSYEGEFKSKAPFSSKKKRKNNDDPPWSLYTNKDNKYICWQDSHWDDDFQVIEYAPKGKFQLPPGMTVEDGFEEFQSGSWTSEQMAEYVEAFKTRELPMPDKVKLKEAAESINVSHGELGLFWYGLSKIDSYGNNFLPKVLREGLGLKVKEASNARDAVQALKPKFKAKLLAAILSGPAEDLWENNGEKVLARLVKAWSGNAPKRLDISADLTKTLGSAAGYRGGSDYVQALADPKKSPYFKATAKWQHGGKDNGTIVTSNASQTFDETTLNVATLAIPLLYSDLPAGAAATKLMADVHAQANACLN
jgi:hypothetical protein